MAGITLEGTRVLIVEDSYLIASTVTAVLEAHGAVIVGMCASSNDAIPLLQNRNLALDVALLDVHLGRDTSYPVADILLSRGVPFVFSTGYDQSSIDSHYEGAPVCLKPYHADVLVMELAAAVERALTGVQALVANDGAVAKESPSL
jgi:DNA-binding LytR/AlgR family response regulator